MSDSIACGIAGLRSGGADGTGTAIRERSARDPGRRILPSRPAAGKRPRGCAPGVRAGTGAILDLTNSWVSRS
jgi:hypothetical protein